MELPPIETLPFLPATWQDDVRRFASTEDGPLSEYLYRLVSIVEQLGARSLFVHEIQKLALFASGLATPDPFSAHRDLFQRLVEAADHSWPVQLPLDEFKCEKDPNQLAKDLYSMRAEWLVLDRLIQEGWSPVLEPRSSGAPDWKVRRHDDLWVDAKYKASPAASQARLAWMLRGEALLEENRFLRNYYWDWSVPANCRDTTIARFQQVFHDVVSELEAVLAEGNGDESRRLYAEEGEELVFESAGPHWFSVTFVHKDGNVGLAGRRRSQPDLGFSAGGGLSGAEVEYSEELREGLGSVIERLKLRKNQDCLFVVMWDVPITWEPGFDWDRMQGWWEELSQEYRWPAAVLWPRGSFEAKGDVWIPNAGATNLLAPERRRSAQVDGSVMVDPTEPNGTPPARSLGSSGSASPVPDSAPSRNPAELSFRFSRIYVIESLRSGERRTGKELYEDFLVPACRNLPRLDCRYYSVQSKGELASTLSDIGDECLRDGAGPLLHLETHGDRNRGLQLANDDWASWEELREPLTRINEASQMNLLVMVAACDGSELKQTLNSAMQRAPIWATIGPSRKLYPHQVLAGSRAFYEALINGDPASGLRSLAAEWGEQENVLPIVFAEWWFERVYAEYRHLFGSSRARNKRVEHLVSDVRTSAGIETGEIGELRRFFKEQLRDEEAFFEAYKRHFFFLDRFPHNEDRFKVSFDDVCSAARDLGND